MGVPVVATDIPGTREVVEAGKTGVLVPVRSWEPLAAAILELIENPTRRQDLGEAGRKRVAELFDERLVFERLLREYEALFQPTQSMEPSSLSLDKSVSNGLADGVVGETTLATEPRRDASR